MKAVQITNFGDPKANIQIVDVAEPDAPGEGEVLIGMEFAPVNHNDLLLMRGYLPQRPALPSIVGNEGVGRILAVGHDVTNVKVGDRVVAPRYSYCWRERLVVEAEGLFALPEEADVQQLAMLRINPPTAGLLLSEFVDLKPGDWIVQNSANSGVGRSVIALASARGFKTINLVRHAELVDELKGYGADVVLLDQPGVAEQIETIVDKSQVRLALDGVSGASTLRLTQALSAHGVLVGYALMSGQAEIPGDLRPIMQKSLTLHTFYMARPDYQPKVPALLREGASLIANGKINVPISAVYPLSSVKEAIAHTERGGKVLLDLHAV